MLSVVNNYLFVTIPFNLHSNDCGAPDCYTNEVSFSFKLGDTLIFPKILKYKEREFGCVDKEKKTIGQFQLIEQHNDFIIYHCSNYKSTLVLFNTAKQSGSTAFFFENVEQNRINGKNVYNIKKEFKEEDSTSIYPFTSWILTTNEYENFIR